MWNLSRHIGGCLAASMLVAVAAACGAPAEDESNEVSAELATDGALDQGAVPNDTVDALGGQVDLVRPQTTRPGIALPTSYPATAAPFQRLELYSTSGEGPRVLELPLGLSASAARLAPGDQLDPALAELGNLLFFDQRLSAGATMACATCHVPSNGFSATQVNVGVHGARMQRTTPASVNRLFGTDNTWIGQRTLEGQSTAPITSPTEMGLTEAQLVAVVSGIPGYAERFARLVQGGQLAAPAVSVANIQRAIATFQRTLMTGGSRVDLYEAGITSALTAQEIAGKGLFDVHCASCHSGGNFTDERYHDIESGCSGLGPCQRPTTSFEAGRFQVTGNLSDVGRFKTPSLRNVGVRAPYFHSGHDATLEIVVHGYNTVTAQWSEVHAMGLSPTQEAQLVAFMRALTGRVEVSAAMSAPGTASSSPYRERYLLSPALFDVAFYRSRNQDLAGIAAMTDDQLRAHWISIGAAQGRRGTSTFVPIEYDTIMANNGGWVSVRAGGGDYLRVVNQYFDRGRRLHPQNGRYMTYPGFFEYGQYRSMNATRIGFSSENAVIHDFLTYGIGNKLPGRRTYIEGTGFRVLGVAGVDHYVKNGAYCTTPHPAGAADTLPIWPYVPSNLPSAGTCP